MKRGRLYLIGCYCSFLVFISALSETELFGAIPGVKLIFGKKWLITLLISIVVSVQGLFINHVYGQYLLVPRVAEKEVAKLTQVIMACAMFIFAILAEKNVGSSVQFVFSAIGFVGYVWFVERLTGCPTFGLPEVACAVVMESARSLPTPINYATVIIAGLFVVRKAFKDEVGKISQHNEIIRQRWCQKLLLVGSTVCLEAGLYVLSLTKLKLFGVLAHWYPFAIASMVSLTFHVWLCKTLIKKIQTNRKLERVGTLAYVVLCGLFFLAAYIANGNVEKSQSFVIALLFLLADLFIVHVLCGVPQFGILEIVAAMMVGTAYDVSVFWCLTTFIVGLLIVLYNCYYLEDNTSTSASSPITGLSHHSSPTAGLSHHSSPIARLSHHSSP